MSWARGRRSLAISDRSGMAFPYTEMVKEWNGSLVHITEYEPKSPQIDPPYHKADAVALQNPRSQRFQQPKQIGAVSANSGGTMVGVAATHLSQLLDQCRIDTGYFLHVATVSGM